MLPGRYELDVPVPGRIRKLTNGTRTVPPRDFELSRDDVGRMLIVVSLKTASLSVEVRGLPSDVGDVAALLFPDDPYITRVGSGKVNPVSARHVEFQYVAPGRYRLFVVDSLCEGDVAYHPRLRDALATNATRIDVSGVGKTRASATYLDRKRLRDAIRQIEPVEREAATYTAPFRCQ